MLRFGVICLVLILAGCQTINAITGSTTTSIEKHPYQVAIDRVRPTDPDDDEVQTPTMLCTGALLTDRLVVTVASCFNLLGGVRVVRDTETTIHVRVGSQFREGGGESFPVSDVAEHPDYNPIGTQYYDVVLLVLQDRVTFRAEVQAVQLGDPNVGLTAGETLVMTGYGDRSTSGRLSDDQLIQMQVATLPLLNQDVCDELLYQTAWGTKACAGGNKIDMCGKADLGAPLVNWRGQLVGIAMKQNDECGLAGQPTVFTNLLNSNIHLWIITTDPDSK